MNKSTTNPGPVKFRTFQAADNLKNEPCALCGEKNCDILAQEKRYGGLIFIAHKPCFDRFVETSERTDEAANVTVDEPITCPKCGSTNWYCWDERSRPCWNSEGHQVSTVVIGGLGCNDCKATWLHYSVPPPDDEDCDCEGWDD